MSSPVNSQLPFTGKVIAVTGAARGIGFGIAKYLTERGAVVSMSDILDTDLKSAKERLAKEAPAGTVDTQVVDVSKNDQVVGWLKGVKERFGKIDGAVNNAGVCEIMPIQELPEEVFDKMISINVKGVFNCLKAEMGLLEDGGSIVNISSVAGLVGIPGISVYCASKHAVIGLTKAAAKEIAPRKIRVNAIAPGSIETDMMRYANSVVGESAASLALLNRYGTPQEIAALAAYLLGDESKFTTSSTYTCDGGYTDF
ncbi:hypothetical protein NKR23_g6456 [Pleurostoma richardsiae]|uniref:Ketoreductase domain-containing protein n=1 Tax=Pleurostoma richardsiae TaxID=41990 RepID=A0AA38RDM8_9PEZI|nr:hypothetical protein NKR23_g6456 [Pleurostoma richardsiae]